MSLSDPKLKKTSLISTSPRYVDTFEPEEKIEIANALQEFATAENAAQIAFGALRDLLRLNGAK